MSIQIYILSKLMAEDNYPYKLKKNYQILFHLIK